MNDTTQPALPSCVINCVVYDKDGKRHDIGLDAISDVLANEDSGFIWVGLYEPADEILEKLQEEFGIDTLAARELAAAKARNQSLTGFPMPELEHGNAAITALASAASVQLKKPGTEFTDEQRDALARRRGQERELLRQQEERKAQLLRSEEEQAWHLSRKALIEPLNDKEQAWLELYRKDYYLVARRIDFTLRKEQEAKAQGQ